MTASTVSTPTAFTTDMLLSHLKGHRALTRRTIEAFPEAQLFSYSAPGMRSFGSMIHELLEMSEPVLKAVAGEGWSLELPKKYAHAQDKRALLEAWDDATQTIESLWATLPPERFLHPEAMFGWAAQPLSHYILYQIDNEIHHRAQGFVYLRLLEIEPPAFYER